MKTAEDILKGKQREMVTISDDQNTEKHAVPQLVEMKTCL